jgi:hypothetical protein
LFLKRSEQQWLPRAHHDRRQPLIEADRRGRLALVPFDIIREADQRSVAVVERHKHHVGVEELAHLTAHEGDHRRDVELCHERLADAVDHRQLGGAPPGLGQQAAGFGEEPDVLDRDTQARRQRAQQAHVRMGEGVFLVEVQQRDHAGGFVAVHQRHEQRRARPCAVQRVAERELLHLMPDQERLAGFEHRALQSAERECLGATALAVPGCVGVVERACRAIILADHHHMCVEHIAHGIAHQVVHGLHVELCGEALLNAVDQRQLGIAAPQFVGVGGRLDCRRFVGGHGCAPSGPDGARARLRAFIVYERRCQRIRKTT